MTNEELIELDSAAKLIGSKNRGTITQVGNSNSDESYRAAQASMEVLGKAVLDPLNFFFGSSSESSSSVIEQKWKEGTHGYEAWDGVNNVSTADAGNDNAEDLLGAMTSYGSDFETAEDMLFEAEQNALKYSQLAIDDLQINAESQRAQLLETQRLYGITGGVAANQLASFDMNYQSELTNLKMEQSSQWYQQTSGLKATLNEKKADAENNAVLEIIRKKAEGTYSMDWFKSSLDKWSSAGMNVDRLLEIDSYSANASRDVWKALQEQNSTVNEVMAEQEEQ